MHYATSPGYQPGIAVLAAGVLSPVSGTNVATTIAAVLLAIRDQRGASGGRAQSGATADRAR